MKIAFIVMTKIIVSPNRNLPSIELILFSMCINSISVSLSNRKLFLFLGDISLVSFEDNCYGLKQTVKID